MNLVPEKYKLVSCWRKVSHKLYCLSVLAHEQSVSPKISHTNPEIHKIQHTHLNRLIQSCCFILQTGSLLLFWVIEAFSAKMARKTNIRREWDQMPTPELNLNGQTSSNCSDPTLGWHLGNFVHESVKFLFRYTLTAHFRVGPLFAFRTP